MAVIIPPYILYTLVSVICFSVASVGFTHFARRLSPLWINAFKATVALVAFSLAMLLKHDINGVPKVWSVVAFFVSGFVGLNLGDLFLMKAFAGIGSARTLLIFSFQPIVLGFFAFLMFGQTLPASKAVAIFFMIACVFTLSFERFKLDGRWELRGPLFAMFGMLLDSCGILLTRWAFNFDPHIGVLEGNFYRCVGAGLGFVAISRFKPFRLWKTMTQFKGWDSVALIGASLLGTFVSLWFYLTAVSRGHLATIAAIVGTIPIFSALLECLIQREWPSKYLYIAFSLFALGFILLI